METPRRQRAARALLVPQSDPLDCFVRSSSSPWPPPAKLETESAHVDHREAERHEKDDDRERRAVAEFQVLPKRIEGVDSSGLRRRPGAPPRHDIDQVEHAKCVERSKNECDENRRLEQRYRYVP